MRSFNPGNNSKKRLAVNTLAVVQGLLLTSVLIVVFAVILAISVSYFDWEAEKKFLSILTQVSLFAGAIWSGNRCQRKSWLNGLITGLLAFLLLTLIGENRVFFGTWLWWRRLIQVGLLSIFGGVLGGLKNH